ncbi:unnamed protein product [Prorocentrum cordatum]|uniref:Uncharacterized protein n=1 Tax=Prorocentrum cordatum TaxID=2364126 RepID=A0ABN9W5W5_9DINO|nr:unnamed protein product [Polarella glacialis]
MSAWAPWFAPAFWRGNPQAAAAALFLEGVALRGALRAAAAALEGVACWGVLQGAMRRRGLPVQGRHAAAALEGVLSASAVAPRLASLAAAAVARQGLALRSVLRAAPVRGALRAASVALRRGPRAAAAALLGLLGRGRRATVPPWGAMRAAAVWPAAAASAGCFASVEGARRRPGLLGRRGWRATAAFWGAMRAAAALLPAAAASADCFTSVAHFEHCCCQASPDCWVHTTTLSAERCCSHLVQHCPRAASPPAAAAGLPEGGVCAGETCAAAEAEEVGRASRPRDDGPGCWELQVYSRTHCCDRRFAPPNSRCFDTLAAASLGGPAAGPAVQTVNVHLTPYGAGGAPASPAPGAGPATRDVGTQTEPEEPAPRSAPAAPTRAPRAARVEAWAYAVWASPAAQDLVGVHCGARRAWDAIAGRTGGYRYFRSDRFRRFASEDEAVAGYLAEEDVFDTGEGEVDDPGAWFEQATPQYVDSVDSDYEVTVAALRVRADTLSTVAVAPSGRLDTVYEAMLLPAWDRAGTPLDGQLLSAEIMETPSALVRRFASAPPAEGEAGGGPTRKAAPPFDALPQQAAGLQPAGQTAGPQLQGAPAGSGGREEQLMALLSQKTSLLGALAQSSGCQPDTLSFLADGGRDDGLGENAGMRLGGARGAAALELFCRQVQGAPRAISAMARRNRQLNMTGAASEEGTSGSTRNYFARNVPFGQARSSAFLVFGMAEVFDLMERGAWHAAEAQLALLLCASEQAALREWRWTSAWLLTHLPEPPWTSIRQAPARGQIRPMSRLASLEWVAAAIGYTKDTLALEGAGRKLAPAPAPKTEEGGGKGGGSKRHCKASGAPPHERLVGGDNSMDVGIRWGFGLIRRLRGLRTAFGAFVRSSMHAAGAQEHMWVNAIVLALSHLHLGETRSCPPRARAGGLSAPLSLRWRPG